jgi:hypothetical protein
MIPFWMELNASDLVQGTAVLSMALTFLFLSFGGSARRV